MAITITIEAKSIAALTREIAELPHGTYATVVATESGAPWATLDISPMTDTRRAIFPNYPGAFRGDTSKRGQSGVHYDTKHDTQATTRKAIETVVARAARMARA